jgi:hypothetical protein
MNTPCLLFVYQQRALVKAWTFKDGEFRLILAPTMVEMVGTSVFTA